MNPSTALNIGSMALVTSFGLGAWLAQLAERYGWCDRPGDALKIHRRPIPLVGGFGVVVGFGLVALSRAGSAVLAGVGIIALMVGAWDDFRWKARAVPGLKFGLQLGAAAAMLGLLQTAGVRFADAPAWVFWTLGFGFVVGSMNAFNLEDGMDGLAGGEAALSALGFAVLLARQGLSAPAFAAVALAGALIGFLVLNWHPARIFLGDGGSHLVGALLAGMALLTISRAGALVVLPVVLMLGLPVFDTVWIIALRLVSGRNPFAGDRGHIYDALYGANSSVPRTVLICWTIHLGLVLIGLALACLGT